MAVAVEVGDGQGAHGLAGREADVGRDRGRVGGRVEEAGAAEPHLEAARARGAPDQRVGDAVPVDVAGGERGGEALALRAAVEHGRVAQADGVVAGEDRAAQPVEDAAARARRAEQEVVGAVAVEVGGGERAQSIEGRDPLDDGGRAGDGDGGLRPPGRREGGQRPEEGQRGERARQ